MLLKLLFDKQQPLPIKMFACAAITAFNVVYHLNPDFYQSALLHLVLGDFLPNHQVNQSDEKRSMGGSWSCKGIKTLSS